MVSQKERDVLRVIESYSMEQVRGMYILIGQTGATVWTWFNLENMTALISSLCLLVSTIFVAINYRKSWRIKDAEFEKLKIELLQMREELKKRYDRQES